MASDDSRRSTNMSIPVHRKPVTDEIMAMANLAADYADYFTAASASVDAGSPEHWTRAVIARAAGSSGQFIWRVLLGLRLDSLESPGHVGGWRIAERGPSWIRLEAASWHLTGRIIIEATEGELAMVTLLRYENWFGSLVWRTLSWVHRALMPRLLRNAIALERASARAASPRGQHRERVA
jgi:hypothetical protein